MRLFGAWLLGSRLGKELALTDATINQNFLQLLHATVEPIASFLNFKLVEMTAGYAKVSIKLRPEYLNFHGVIFGGIIMSLADQAFGYAVNSLNYPGVASQFNIYFLASALPEDELTAEGKVIKNGKRVSVAEVSITNQNGKLIAKATGTTISVATPSS
jgi:acyl-CoA thioesterase